MKIKSISFTPGFFGGEYMLGDKTDLMDMYNSFSKDTHNEVAVFSINDLPEFRIDTGQSMYIPQEEKQEKALKDDTDSKERFLSHNDNTETSTHIIERNLEKIDEENKDIVAKIHHTDFFDGYTNEVVERFQTMFERMPYETVLFINKLYSTHPSDKVLISGLLRTISLLDVQCYSPFLIPVVRAGISDTSADVEESVIMVFERWRTKECLDALKNSIFPNPLIRQYAEIVKAELESELNH